MVRYRVTYKDGSQEVILAANADSLIRFLGEYDHMVQTVACIEIGRTANGMQTGEWGKTAILKNGATATAVRESNYNAMMEAMRA